MHPGKAIQQPVVVLTTLVAMGLSAADRPAADEKRLTLDFCTRDAEADAGRRSECDLDNWVGAGFVLAGSAATPSSSETKGKP